MNSFTNDIMQVQWNVKGLPIGENGTHFRTFLGSKVKQMIPITITTWVDTKNPVLKKQKHELWLTLQVYNFRSFWLSYLVIL